MKMILFSVLTTCFLVSGARAQNQPRRPFTYEQLVDRHDRNKDGSITRDEFRGNPQMFERFDVDKNQTVTRDEFDAAIKEFRKRQGRNNRYEEGRNRFTQQGLQPGQQVPELTVYDLEGKEILLSNLWKEKPALLVTASATCPISVRTCPTLKSLSSVNANYVNVGILYIKEAHPAEEADPSSQAVGARTHPQPSTLEEKLKLARLFNEQVDHGTRILVDSIDNTAATALGAGPNMGLFISTDGRIIQRQGWFEPKAMTYAIIEFDGTVPEAPTPEPGNPFRMRQAPQGATLHRDIEYAVEDGESLQLDLYLPEKMDPPPPLIVWIHGGGWKNGDKANVNGAILKLSGDGYAVASINYRLKDLSIHPKNIHDCKGAVRWLRAHAKEYGFDPGRVAVGGGSAGGHLALLLGLSSGHKELEGTVGGNPDQSSAVKAIVDLYGPSDFMSFAKNSDRFNRAHEFQQEQLKHASPLTYLSKDDPPVLVFHGDRDKTVPVEQSKLLHERYREAGLESELHLLEGAGHGGRVFSDDERYTLIKTFLDRHLR